MYFKSLNFILRKFITFCNKFLSDQTDEKKKKGTKIHGNFFDRLFFELIISVMKK